MARSVDQTIPPELLIAYNRTLAQPRLLMQNWGSRPDMRDLILSRYTPFPDQRRNPSILQELRRDAFAAAAATWDSYDTRMKLAYLQLAAWEESWPWPEFLHRHLNEFVSGEAPGDLPFNNVSPTKPEMPTGAGYLIWECPGGGEVDINFQATIGPAPYYPHFPDMCEDSYALIVQHWDQQADPPDWAPEFYQGFNPTSISELDIDIELEDEDTIWREMHWYRSTSIESLAPVWSIDWYGERLPYAWHGYYTRLNPP